MTELLGLENFSLVADGPTLTLSIGGGQSLGIYGPAASGKSRFLRSLAGFERPGSGEVMLTVPYSMGAREPLSRRTKPLALARKKGPNQAALATELLLATRLWEARNTPLGELSPSQWAAAELLPLLNEEAPLMLIDGLLDRLDPWTLQSVREYLNRRRAAGDAMVVATNRPELANMFDAVIVLRDQRVRFAGTVADLLRSGPSHTVTVGTEKQPEVRALVDPFQVSVQPTADGWRFEAPEGQELAARLLLEGYGDVEFVVLRAPTVEEALVSLIS